MKKGLKHYFICEESNCNKIFFNDDDNICAYCGSKDTTRIIIEKIWTFTEYETFLKKDIKDW